MIFTRRAAQSVINLTETRPALTTEARQNQLVALAMNRAEQQLIDGTASSQVITHFLKVGSIEKQIELEKLRKENELLAAKTESIKAAARNEEITARALEAFRSYAGIETREEIIDEFEE